MPAGLSKEEAAGKDKAFSAELAADIKSAGYLTKADPDQMNKPMVLLLLFNIYYGLWYPIVIAAATFVIGMLFVKETKDYDIYQAER